MKWRKDGAHPTPRQETIRPEIHEAALRIARRNVEAMGASLGVDDRRALLRVFFDAAVEEIGRMGETGRMM